MLSFDVGGGSAGNVTVVTDSDPTLGSHFLTTGVNSDAVGGISLAKLSSGSSGGIHLGGPDHVTLISGSDNGSKRNASKMEVVDSIVISAPAMN